MDRLNTTGQCCPSCTPASNILTCHSWIILTPGCYASTSSGWSTDGGQTKGAYYPEVDPSGSSSGSAVGTSIGLAVAALGTEV